MKNSFSLKKILLVVMLFVLGARGYAQTTAAAYNFTATTGTFTSISGTGTWIGSAFWFDDATVTSIPIGFNFTFCGTVYNQGSINTNGWFSLNNSAPGAAAGRNNTAANVANCGPGLLMPYWDDLDGSLSGEGYYRTTGASPNRVFTLEWNVWPSFLATGTATFQIKLYEGTNNIEFVYGAGSYAGSTATIGIANSTTDYQTLPGTGASPLPSSTVFTTGLTGSPASGQIYRWYGCAVTASATNSGPVCPGSALTLTGVSSGTSFSWAGPSGYSSTSLVATVPSAVAGIYTLSATSGTCTTTATTTVVLSSAPPAPVVTPSVATICNGGTATLTATTPASSGTILSQNFNGTIAPWVVDNTGTVGGVAVSPWQLRPSGYTYAGTLTYTFTPPDLSQFLITIADAGGSGSTTATKVTSPVFSLAGYSAATLTFQHAYQSFGTEQVRVEISTDGGTTWITINNYAGTTTGTSTSFASASFPLTAYLGQPNCRLRFNYNSPWGWWWALDNVLISGTPTTGAAPSWSPVTDLFSNPALTTAYVAGTPANTVYVHPTTVATSTVVNYIASVTSGGCTSSDTSVVTINPGVPAITGSTVVCLGSSTTLFNTATGGTWSTSNTTVASINATTGVITGLSSGTDTVFYTVTGCTNFTVVTVNSGTTPITGPSSVCVSGSVTLSNATTGGTWTISPATTATVNSTTGVVTGLVIGTAIVTYTAPVTGCTDTALVNVIGAPNPIGGSMVVCYGGGITTLTETTPGGSWSSGSTGIATVDAATGAVYGVSGGVAVISYTLPSGCYAVASVTVNPPLPAITGPSAVCAGSSITLNNTATGGTWSSGTLAAATVTASGSVGGVASGSSMITYSTSVGCNAIANVTVNPLPAPIGGPSAVCAGGATIALTNATGTGSWSSSGPSATATLTSGGVVTGVTAGSVTITYTLPVTGCYVTAPVTVNTLPSAISGASAVCEGGATATVADATPSGSWSAGPAGTLSVDAIGTITGGTAGAGTVTYTLPLTGCYVTRAIAVNALPAAIGGTPTVCINSFTTLTNATPSGVWSSSNTAIASIGSSGIMGGVATGSATITYTIPLTGCYNTVAATVNPLPLPIGGITDTVCGGGATITLTDATPGGTWSSGATGTAIVDAATGVVSGVAAGTAPITYTITATGCYISTNVTVLPIPAVISGTTSVCEAGGITTLTDATVPGTWSISSGTTATITSGGGVTGGTAGTATVTYTRSNGCYITTPLTVNPLPAAITGTLSVCQLSVTTLSSASGGGTWTVGSPFIASVSAGGGVGGIAPGTSTVTYTLPTGCLTSATVTVNAIPGTIIGQNYVCFGGITTLSNVVTGGTWSSSNSTIASVEATTGIVHGLVVGAATITYTTGTNGCVAVLPITVNGIVSPTVTLIPNPGTTVCAGTPVTYSAAVTNGGTSPLYVWSVNNLILSNAMSYTYTPADGDLVRLWVLSSYSCAIPDTASSWVTMTVNPIVTPAVSISTGTGDTVCVGALTTMTATPVSGGTAPTYQWLVNLVPVATGPVYPFIANDGDVVTCIMTSNAFCRTATTASATRILTVSPMLTPFVTINPSLGLTTCEGYPETFTALSVNGGMAPFYQWSVNGVNTGTGVSYTYPPANYDDVRVTMTSNFPCLITPTATENINVTVLPITQPVGIVSAVPGYIVAPGMYDTFTCTIISGGGIAPTYQWYKSSFPVPGATSNVYITNDLHTGDSVSCEVTNTDQCSGVSVFNYVNITVGYNVGVSSVANTVSNIMLVPNPNAGTFTIKGVLGSDLNEDATLEITDMLGKTIYNSNTRIKAGGLDEQVSLNGNIANGIYLLTVRSAHVTKTIQFAVQQ